MLNLKTEQLNLIATTSQLIALDVIYSKNQKRSDYLAKEFINALSNFMNGSKRSIAKDGERRIKEIQKELQG